VLDVCVGGVVAVPSLLFDMLLSSNPHRQSSSASAVVPVLSGCVRLLRSLARDNGIIQRRIFERLEALLDVHAIHNDIALLVRDVRPSIINFIYNS